MRNLYYALRTVNSTFNVELPVCLSILWYFTFTEQIHLYVQLNPSERRPLQVKFPAIGLCWICIYEVGASGHSQGIRVPNQNHLEPYSIEGHESSRQKGGEVPANTGGIRTVLDKSVEGYALGRNRRNSRTVAFPEGKNYRVCYGFAQRPRGGRVFRLRDESREARTSILETS